MPDSTPASSLFPRKFPRRGEIYIVDFGEPRGSAQAGKRPAVVVSNDVGNQHSPVVIVAAMTSKKVQQRRKYPTVVFVPAGEMKGDGLIVCNQLLTIDKADLIAYKAVLTQPQVDELNEALRVGVGIPRRFV
ncbi:MAG: mazF [Solirubrobacterales bacterium]|nr:mazF [Solirubrobacterales bacterium]